MDTELFGKAFFDRKTERHGTGSIKYSEHIIGKNNTIPMWVADMDFESPPAVVKALTDASAHGIYGYTEYGDDYDEIICGWYKRRTGWEIKPDWIIKTPGVIFGISSAIRALTQADDGVIICQPVYYPFERIIKANERRAVISELRLNDGNGRYEVDFDDFEGKIIREKVKLFLLCSPHNPVGRVWTRDELLKLGEICVHHGVYIVSDEIHSDFVYPGSVHTPISSLENLAECTVTCIAPTKTFNLAGLQSAQIVAANPELRKKIEKDLLAVGYGELNLMAIQATRAAYRYGDAWLDGLLEYLRSNIDLLRSELSQIDKISLVNPEGTYLMWLDCRLLGLDDAGLRSFFQRKAGVFLNGGAMFGMGGNGFMRLNIACPSTVLTEALGRIRSALG